MELVWCWVVTGVEVEVEIQRESALFIPTSLELFLPCDPFTDGQSGPNVGSPKLNEVWGFFFWSFELWLALPLDRTPENP